MVVTIYFAHRVVRQYPVSDATTCLNISTPHAQPFETGSYTSFLVEKAELYGTQAGKLIRSPPEDRKLQAVYGKILVAGIWGDCVSWTWEYCRTLAGPLRN
jgi:hypothetical protein